MDSPATHVKKTKFVNPQKHIMYHFRIRKYKKGPFVLPEYSQEDIDVLSNFLKSKGMSQEYISLVKERSEIDANWNSSMEIDKVTKDGIQFIVKITVEWNNK